MNTQFVLHTTSVAQNEDIVRVIWLCHLLFSFCNPSLSHEKSSRTYHHEQLQVRISCKNTRAHHAATLSVGLVRKSSTDHATYNSLNHSVLHFRCFSAGQQTRGRSQKTYLAVLARIACSLNVQLGSKVLGGGYGTYGQWIFSLAWIAWLGFLCIAETAPDYLHLTKRFGLIAASRLLIHYLLAALHRYSPVQLSFRRVLMARICRCTKSLEEPSSLSSLSTYHSTASYSCKWTCFVEVFGIRILQLL